MSPQPKPGAKRGGTRAGAGRPAIDGGTEIRVTLPPDMLALAERLAGRAGKGAAAAGIRRALDIAAENPALWEPATPAHPDPQGTP